MDTPQLDRSFQGRGVDSPRRPRFCYPAREKGMGTKRPKQRGHFCWCCGRLRANERFSGSGHRRHLCRDCAKLGKEELAYQQAVRNIDRLLTWDGVIPRHQRPSFERFLHHPSERVRNYAQGLAARDEQERAQRRQAWMQEEADIAGVSWALSDEWDPTEARIDDTEDDTEERECVEDPGDIPF